MVDKIILFAIGWGFGGTLCFIGYLMEKFYPIYNDKKQKVIGDTL